MSMSDTAANVAVCNQSLGMLGAEKITVGSGTEQNHIYATTFFDDARDEILAAHKWNFAKKRAYAIETTKPLFGYDNAFTKPSDCIKVWQVDLTPKAKFEVEGGLILTDEGTAAEEYSDDSEEYLAGEYLSISDVTYLVNTAFTSSDETTDISSYMTTQSGDYDVLMLEYVYQRTDVDKWPVAPRQCLIINLARMLSSPIKQNEEVSLNLQAMLYGSKKVIGYLDTARSIDAQEGGAISLLTYKFIDARRRRG